MAVRCLGLIGGLGPPATIHYYRALVDAFAARGEPLRLVMSHADASHVLACVRRNDLDGLAEYFAGHIRSMASAGADIAAIPAVTPHICAPALAPLSALPIVDMIDATRAALQARGLERISLMGTRFVMESDLFGRLPGVDIVRAAPNDMKFIDDAYMGIVASGHISPESVERLRKIARGLVADAGVHTVVLAGTDLALAFDEATAGFPALDCARVHLDAVVGAMLA